MKTSNKKTGTQNSWANANVPAKNNASPVFSDNRPEAIAQRKIQEMANASPQNIFQLKERHVVKKAVTPNIHTFTEEAIGKGAPSSLTYWPNKLSVGFVRHKITGQIVTISSVPEDQEENYDRVGVHEVNRFKALVKGSELKVIDPSYKGATSRDEYPYASTMEGGTDSFWAHVPAAEQSSQGGSLAGLYGRLTQKGETEFDVVPD